MYSNKWSKGHKAHMRNISFISKLEQSYDYNDKKPLSPKMVSHLYNLHTVTFIQVSFVLRVYSNFIFLSGEDFKNFQVYFR